jgi:cardiolipin synthase
MMFKVTGPLAASLQSAFVSSWVGSSGEILVGRDSDRGEADESGVGRFIHLVNSPAPDAQSMSHFFVLSILAARKSVYIATPYFIPDQHLKNALLEKAKSGVEVRLLLPGKEIDYQVVRLSAQSHYQDLLRAGVRIYEYRPTFLHSKFVIVDGAWSIIGSANLNSRSRLLDEENAQGILDTALSERLTECFLSDLEQSVEIRLEEWQRRSVFLKFVQRLAQILDKQS